MRKFIAIACASLLLAGCSTTGGFKEFSQNYRATVFEINADIAATAPLVARGCADLQTLAALIEPYAFVQQAKAPQYFNSANSALGAFCQNVPTDIASTAAALARAIKAARDGYYRITKGV